MLGFKAFRCTRILLGGIELMHMIGKGQMKCARGYHPSAADQFYELATEAVLCISIRLYSRALLRQNLRRAAHRPAASAPVAAQAASDGSLYTACIICRISMAAGIDAKVPCRSTASAAAR